MAIYCQRLIESDTGADLEVVGAFLRMLEEQERERDRLAFASSLEETRRALHKARARLPQVIAQATTLRSAT